MNLSDIFKNIPLESQWKSNLNIQDLCYHSQEACANSLFFAIKGYKTDGHNFVEKALNKGAALAVIDCPESVDKKYHDQCLIVPSTRKALAQASANFFHHPTQKLVLVGVTGSNGKTTCVHIIESIFKATGKATALMSTICESYRNHRKPSRHTTQESYNIQKFMAQALKAGTEYAVIEVSSHALSLSRVDCCAFDAVLFNNLQADHLDFHKDMNDYFQAKLKLFTEFSSPAKKLMGASNIDDHYGKKALKEAAIPMKSFGLHQADFSGEGLKASRSGIKGQVTRLGQSPIKIDSKLMGTFNCVNLTASVAIASLLKIPTKAIGSGIANIEQIPGRASIVPTKLPYDIFVDFAHNGSTLYSTLKMFREICKNKLIVVFGAGGDRDPLRRTAMGEAAAKLAHISVITTDNPRSEDPRAIINDIVNSWRTCVKREKIDGELIVEVDRKKAIRRALHLAEPCDVVCIAGRGHEREQVIKNKTILFDDKKVAEEIARELENV